MDAGNVPNKGNNGERKLSFSDAILNASHLFSFSSKWCIIIKNIGDFSSIVNYESKVGPFKFYFTMWNK